MPDSLQRPAVHRWYARMCLLLAAMYSMGVAIGMLFLLLDVEPLDIPMNVTLLRSVGVLCVALSLPLTLAYLAGPFLPQRKWAWTFGLALILLSVPLGLPLLPSWMKPKTKAWFTAGSGAGDRRI